MGPKTVPTSHHTPKSVHVVPKPGGTKHLLLYRSVAYSTFEKHEFYQDLFRDFEKKSKTKIEFLYCFSVWRITQVS